MKGRKNISSNQPKTPKAPKASKTFKTFKTSKALKALKAPKARPKVKVIPVKIKNLTGYDILILDTTATIQDYVDALNNAILLEPLARTRVPEKRKNCFGCYLCCGERIPLTFLDALKLSELFFKKKHFSKEKSRFQSKETIYSYARNGHANNFPHFSQLHKFIERYGYVLIEGRAVDITLRLQEDGLCPFLDRNKHLCTIYEYRPLVCQTFICCPQTKRARELRSGIVNTGEDELVRQYLLGAMYAGREPLIHEAYEPDLRLDDWKATAFAGKNDYNQVFLKDICNLKKYR